MSPHGVSPMIEPAALAMTHFWNNVAHSNYVRGFHLQMTSDYRSQPTTKLLGGIRAFKNSGPGILISNSENVIIEGGHFSDNRGNIDMHRSEDVQIRNVSIVGKSKELELLEVTQPLLSAALCPNRQTVISAIGFRSFTRAGRGTGMTVQDVDISGFEDISTCKEYAFLLDPEVS